MSKLTDSQISKIVELLREELFASTAPWFAPPKEACVILGLKRSKLYEEIGAGHIWAYKNNKSLLVDLMSGRRRIQSLPRAQIRSSARARRRAEQASQQS
jgi:hypothetical protein